MNKEVEDALHLLLHCSLKDTEYETQFEQYKIVRNYITNLQQENKQLKEQLENDIDRYEDTISYQLGFDKGKEYMQQRIDKAIEYIYRNWITYDEATKFTTFNEEMEVCIKEIKELLEILGDGNNE